jgi:HEAT repeat protein
VSNAALRKSMADRAAGLTPDDLLADLARVDAGAALADKNRWLWRASGLLRLQPGLSEDLADLILDPSTHHAGRALALDLLVSVGHDAAQAALRRAFAGGEDWGPGAHTLANRLGFLLKPAPATAALVAQRFATAEGEHRTAWGYTLGAVASHLDAEAAHTLTRPLAAGLATAETSTDRRHFLRALGNAGLEADVALIGPHTRDADPRVRKAAAGALRKCNDSASEALLAGLLTDPDPDVQQSAARALARRELTPDHFAAFTSEIAAGRLHEAAWPELLDALRRQRAVDPAGVEAVLGAMLARPITQPRLRARINGLRG